MKKVYFSGSIRGGREDLAIYQEWIRRLRETTEVLTEFIGDSTLEEKEARTLTDRDIYERDVRLLEACDVVVAECTQPSLGVGYELSYAERLGKPALLLFREGGERRLSAMLRGNPRFHTIYYRNVVEGWELLREYL